MNFYIHLFYYFKISVCYQVYQPELVEGQCNKTVLAGGITVSHTKWACMKITLQFPENLEIVQIKHFLDRCFFQHKMDRKQFG